MRQGNIIYFNAFKVSGFRFQVSGFRLQATTTTTDVATRSQVVVMDYSMLRNSNMLREGRMLRMPPNGMIQVASHLRLADRASKGQRLLQM